MEPMEPIKYAPLFSGSSGNCAFLRAGELRLLIDAGLPLCNIEQALESIGESTRDVDALLITHEHTDHIRGLGALCRRYRLPVYANAPTWEAMGESPGRLPPNCVRIFESGRPFFLKGVSIHPFPVPHDAAQAVGFRLDCPAGSFAQATDVGYVDDRLIDVLSGCALVMLEANHDEDMLRAGPYPYPLKRRILSDQGHLSNEAAGRALVRLFGRGVKSAILGHLSLENNYAPLALETVRSLLREENILEGELTLTVALRDRPTGVFEVCG